MLQINHKHDVDNLVKEEIKTRTHQQRFESKTMEKRCI